MQDRIVTIFGGAGFVGRYVVRLLAQQGWIVRIAQRHAEDASFLKPAGNVGQILLVNSNILDEKSVRRALDGACAVINLVGILAPSGRQQFSKIHTEGAARIAKIAGQVGIERLLHMSALGADPHSSSSYARSKGLGELEVLKAFPSATIFRPSILFGPEDQFFNRFAQMARISPFLPLIGGGKTRFQPLYIEDMAKAMAHALHQSESRGRIYELGGPHAYSFRELMERMAGFIGRQPILLPIPFILAYPLAAMMQWMPGAPLTLDQVRLLRRDNVLSGKYPGCIDLGIEPQVLSDLLLSYLSIYRKDGSYEHRK